MREEETVRRALSRQRRDLHVHGGRLLVEPDAIRTANGGPYRVFTPFFRTWRELADPAAPSPAPAVITGATPPPDAIAPAVMPSVTPDPLAYWQTGERGALDRLQRFLDEAAEQYEEDRDRPGVRGTSESSPGLSMGEIAPGRIMREVRAEGADGAETFVRQLAWRDFAHHVLHHSPHLLDTPLRSEFEAFPWRDDPSALAAWQEGRTGFPLVDAGMRQLLATGWMHNRARLVCGSFLTKHLLIPWQRGEEWFRDRLVDHDEAVNAFNWQWVAGSGADAAPYFRIFNPTLQGERFDPGGTYVRTWVPELETLPDRWIHHPWDAPRDVLASATITPGVTYPGPIVEHAEARSRALAAYEAMRISRGR
jgi:deoxyribodipyrimidine photo-lyase